MFRIKIIIVCSILGLLSSTRAVAQDTPQIPSVYVSAFVDRYSLGLIDTTVQLHPVVASAAIGVWVREGIGIELEVGGGVGEETIGDLDVAFDSKLAIGLRLESPPIERIAAYALFNYVKTSYDASVNDATLPVSLPGGRIAAGLTFLVAPNTLIDAAVTHHDYDGDTRVNSVRVGVRFNLGASR